MFAASRRAVYGLSRPATAQATAASFTKNPAAFRRLLSVLAVLEQREGKLNVGSLSAVTAAKKLGGSIHGFVAGGNIKPVADEAAKVEGVEKIIAVDNAAYDRVRLAGPRASVARK